MRVDRSFASSGDPTGVTPVFNGVGALDGLRRTLQRRRDRLLSGGARSLLAGAVRVPVLAALAPAVGRTDQVVEYPGDPMALYSALVTRSSLDSETVSAIHLAASSTWSPFAAPSFGNPSSLILDEPSLGLAPIIVDAVHERIAEVQQKGTTVLLVEQDVPRARQASDSMCFLSAGVVTGAATSTNSDEVARMATRTFVGVGGQIGA